MCTYEGWNVSNVSHFDSSPKTLNKHGIESSLMRIPGEDHFSLVENLGQAEFPLAKVGQEHRLIVKPNTDMNE